MKTCHDHIENLLSSVTGLHVCQQDNLKNFQRIDTKICGTPFTAVPDQFRPFRLTREPRNRTNLHESPNRALTGRIRVQADEKGRISARSQIRPVTCKWGLMDTVQGHID
jgi:hypothetical protein